MIGSTARDIIERSREPVVVAGPFVVHPDPEDETAIRPLGVDHLVVCVDGTPASERGLPVAAAWAHALGMKLTLVTVAEPCPPPVRIGAPWRRHHGPNEDADEYVRRLGEQWALAAPGLDTFVVYDPISAAAGMKDYLAAHPTGLIAVTSHLRDRFAHMVFGSGAADIVHTSTAPALVIPAPRRRGVTRMDGGLLILWVVVGVALIGHGTQKLFGWFGGHGRRGTGAFFELLGYRPGAALRGHRWPE